MLRTPSLWSAVAETPPKDSNFYCRAPFWHYYIHRCISGPLYVDVNACVSEETFALLSQHCNRVRKLSVTGNSKHVREDDSLLALSIPLPNVEKCQIADAYPARSLTPGSSPATALQILGGSCARLRCLVLWNVTFIPSNTFPSLTSFTFCLHNPPDCHVSSPELWTNLLEFLSRSPALCTIGIFNVADLGASPSLNLEWKPLQNQIQLPNLRKLSLQDHNYWDGFCDRSRRYEPNTTISKYRGSFLGAIHIPPTCRLHLGPVYNPSDMLVICNPLPSFGWRIPTIAHMVSRVDNEAKTLSVETSDLDTPELEQTHLRVDIDAPWHCPNYPSLSSLPIFAKLRELWIELDVYASFIRVGGFLNLAELGNLETLVICRVPQSHDDPANDQHYDPLFSGCRWQTRPTLATARNILQPLQVSGPSFSGPASCPCPCLTTLRVDVVWSTSVDGNVDEAGYVHELAASRAAAGCPIFRLLIGIIFREDFPPKPYVVSQYDAEGQLISTGNHEADGLAGHWRNTVPAE